MNALALAAVAACLPAWAAPVLHASSAAAAFDGTNHVAGTPSTDSSPGYVNSNTYANQALGNASGYSFANGNGAYAVSSQAEGKGSSSAQATLTYTVSNTSSVAQSYSMSFYIYYGYLEAMTAWNGPGLSAGESLSASYGASIIAGGNTVFSSGATLTRTMDGTSVVETGTQLQGANLSGGYYSWSGATYTVELGILQAGESMDVLAQLDDMVIADVGTYEYTGGGGYGYGYGCTNNYPTAMRAETAAEQVCFVGSARAFYGDPVDFWGQPDAQPDVPITFTGTPVVGELPEPGTLALAALAMLAAATGSRRRRPAPQA